MCVWLWVILTPELLFDFQGVFHSVCQCSDSRQTSVCSSKNMPIGKTEKCLYFLSDAQVILTVFFLLFFLSLFYDSSVPDATMQVSLFQLFNMKTGIFLGCITIMVFQRNYI